jgi:hypothetical protein
MGWLKEIGVRRRARRIDRAEMNVRAGRDQSWIDRLGDGDVAPPADVRKKADGSRGREP